MNEKPKNSLPPPSPIDALDYMAQISLSMGQLARRNAEPMLVYLFGMAEAEARRRAQEIPRDISSTPSQSEDT